MQCPYGVLGAGIKPSKTAQNATLHAYGVFPAALQRLTRRLENTDAIVKAGRRSGFTMQIDGVIWGNSEARVGRRAQCVK